jgi:hypothetical protein
VETNPLTAYQASHPTEWEKIMGTLATQTNKDLFLIIDPSDDEGSYFAEFEEIKDNASPETMEDIHNIHQSKPPQLSSVIVISNGSPYFALLDVRRV